MWKCAICDLEFGTIPDDAVRLTHTMARTNVFRFSNGAIHSLRKIRLDAEVHNPPEGPKEDTELLQTVAQALVELPNPQPQPEVIEEVEEPTTTMAAAYRRSFKS